MLLLGLQWIYVLCICYTIVSDFRDLLIPNWIIITLVSTFAVFAAVYMEPRSVLVHVALALIFFSLFLGFFIVGWVAGGDVKFITAVALWMGLEQVGNFVLATAVLGGVLAFVLLQVKKYGFLVGGPLSGTWLFRRVSTMAEHSQCPYGVAIGIAALLSSGGIFQ